MRPEDLLLEAARQRRQAGQVLRRTGGLGVAGEPFFSWKETSSAWWCSLERGFSARDLFMKEWCRRSGGAQGNRSSRERACDPTREQARSIVDAPRQGP